MDARRNRNGLLAQSVVRTVGRDSAAYPAAAQSAALCAPGSSLEWADASWSRWRNKRSFAVIRAFLAEPFENDAAFVPLRGAETI